MKLHSVGDRVSQTTYGPGTITLLNEYHTIIEFDEHGSRTFATPLVRLAASNTTAPVRPKRARRRRVAV